MLYLQAARYQNDEPGSEFPYSLPFLESFKSLTFTEPVTFLVGENGCGKSTFLEALACSCESVTVGGRDIWDDPDMIGPQKLSDKMRLVWKKRTRRGFFMRAEDFYGFGLRIEEMKREFTEMAQEFEGEYEGHARDLAMGAPMGQLAQLKERYGEGFHTMSHGEGFLKIFEERFVPGGLYFLDEPETPLSPTRQLSLISLLKQMVAEDAQFIIATHSPILMAFERAEILSFEQSPPEEVAYDDVGHVKLYREFLKAPSRYLRHL